MDGQRACQEAIMDLPHLLLALGRRAGLANPQAWGSGVSPTLDALTQALPPKHNLDIVMVDGLEPFGEVRPSVRGELALLPPPRHLTAVPPGFSSQSHEAWRPGVRLLRLPGGYLCHFNRVPLVLTGSGREILRDYSSRYARLVHYVDFDLRGVLATALEIPGSLLVLEDDVHPSNFCHWLVDWLPRLALLEGVANLSEVYVAVPILDAPYQRELLALCGIDPGRIVELAPMQAVQARELLVSSDLSSPPHPAFKGSGWATAGAC
jgi:hypothetical protein